MQRAAYAPATRQPQRKRLTASLAMALTGCGLALAGAPTLAAAPQPAGAARIVTSCADDADPGTLRNVIAGAASGDTVDLSALTCSTISLTAGAIDTPLDDLTLRGPGTTLTIDAGGASALFEHYGAGTLAIERVTLANGSYAGGGACIFSTGNVVLTQSTVRDCRAAAAAGGGVLALGDLDLDASTLTGNFAAAGGGATAGGAIHVRNSTISGNVATAIGGGLYADGTLADGARLSIVNSTLTGNQADAAGGGVYIGYAVPMTLQSAIIAGNTAPAGHGADIGAYAPLGVGGANNLVIDSTLVLPADTLATDPRLLPLADNGGPTPTHALEVGSPAIDAGNNAAQLEFDQRGIGHARTVGGATDIGAFEVQVEPGDDTIFVNGFDA